MPWIHKARVLIHMHIIITAVLLVMMLWIGVVRLGQHRSSAVRPCVVGRAERIDEKHG